MNLNEQVAAAAATITPGILHFFGQGLFYLGILKMDACGNHV